MAPQLQINQGPQDALLFDNTRSYFTNVGYVRTSNFQMELRDVDPSGASANLGGTVNFIIPKAADLLGPVDLCVKFADVKQGPSTANAYWGWVESIGYAMIEKITFSVGMHDVETLTGEHLNIINELMRDDTHRYGFKQIGKTGRPLVRCQLGDGGTNVNNANPASFRTDTDLTPEAYDRLIAYHDGTSAHIKQGKELIIPLGLFFTLHPSKYFPLAAIAGCNDVRIAIKFRTLNELLMSHTIFTRNDAVHISTTPGTIQADGSTSAATVTNKEWGIIKTDAAPADAGVSAIQFSGSGSAFDSKGCYLRCHYIHVTGPESTALMSKEHVRLMKLWHGNEKSQVFKVSCAALGVTQTLHMDLNFLHPVTELVITIRKLSDMGSDINNSKTIGSGSLPAKNTAQTKSYFAYHGGGKDPNMESWPNCVEEQKVVAAHTSSGTAPTRAPKPSYLLTKAFTLKLNGQSRHLDGNGIDRNYLMNRLMPMLHSNTSIDYEQVAASSFVRGVQDTDTTTDPQADFKMLAQMMDRKEIYVYPFALNPEGANPSGSVNFSKVSHAKLSIDVEGFAPSATGSVDDEYQVDVYGLYYNWLAIKDGRALTSFS